MKLLSYVFAASIAFCSIAATPVEVIEERNLTPVQCSKVAVIVKILKLHQATPFCSKFLSIKPTIVTSTAVVTTTVSRTNVITITAGATSTSIVFSPGNPPTKAVTYSAAKEKRDAAYTNSLTSPYPDYIKGYAAPVISSACKCLNIPRQTKTQTITSTATSTTSIVKTATVSPPIVTSTYYPCATPVPSKIPTLPYGISNGQGVLETNNDLYGFDTTGGTLEGCCNLCFFEIPNCVQAFYYSYQGCVVQKGSSISGSGQGISDVCPNGKISGLRYGRDTNPPFRSTGNIAGPCGVGYDNL